MLFLVLSTLVVVLAGLHVSEASVDHIEVDCFGVGQSVTAVYTAPSIEGMTVILVDGEGGIVLHMNFRLEGRVLILNTMPADQSWGPEERVNNYYFTPGQETELIAKAEDGKFAVIANGV